jgi:hypothetical protein
LREVGDGLELAILPEEEVVAGEVGDGLSGFVADDGGDGDEARGDFEGGVSGVRTSWARAGESEARRPNKVSVIGRSRVIGVGLR